MRFSISNLINVAVTLQPLVVAFPASTVQDVQLPAAYVEVEVFPGDTRIFTGDISEIVAQVLAINPDYTASPTEIAAEPALEKRNTIFPPSCWDRAVHGANRPDAVFMIRDLRSMNMAYKVAARTCVRLGCFNNVGLAPNSGIALCNDNNWEIAPNTAYLASYVEGIRDYCTTGSRFAGQLFDTDNYNVLVKSMNCGLPRTWPVGQFPN